MKIKSKETLREISFFLFFGMLTTIIAWTTYFGALWVGENLLNIPTDSDLFYVVRVVAQSLEWIVAVLFAFVTNKKWVFTNADNSISTLNQLLRFSASRLVSLGIDTAVTFTSVWILHKLDYYDINLGFIGLENITLSADFVAKTMITSVFVVISNYVFSKLFVFRATEAKCKNK